MMSNNTSYSVHNAIPLEVLAGAIRCRTIQLLGHFGLIRLEIPQAALFAVAAPRVQIASPCDS